MTSVSPDARTSPDAEPAVCRLGSHLSRLHCLAPKRVYRVPPPPASSGSPLLPHRHRPQQVEFPKPDVFRAASCCVGADGTHSGLGLIKILLIFPLAVEGSEGKLVETTPRPPPAEYPAKVSQRKSRGDDGRWGAGECGGPHPLMNTPHSHLPRFKSTST